MYYVYFLFSQQANKFYVGHSADPWKRLNQHLSNGGDKYTGYYHDWVLTAVFEVSEKRGDADRIEKFIKRQKAGISLLKFWSLSLKEQECLLSWLESRMCGINHGVCRTCGTGEPEMAKAASNCSLFCFLITYFLCIKRTPYLQTKALIPAIGKPGVKV